MKQILGEIQSGQFADEWVAESESGRENYHRMQDEGKTHPIETVGAAAALDDALDQRRQAERRRSQRRRQLTTLSFGPGLDCPAIQTRTKRGTLTASSADGDPAGEAHHGVDAAL